MSSCHSHHIQFSICNSVSCCCHIVYFCSMKNRKFCFLFYTLPEQSRALGPISTPTMLGSVVPMVPMFWTAALAFSIRLQKKFHVPKIIVTIHRTQKSEAALEEARAFLETRELLLFTTSRTQPRAMLQNVVLQHFGNSCWFVNGFCDDF